MKDALRKPVETEKSTIESLKERTKKSLTDPDRVSYEEFQNLRKLSRSRIAQGRHDAAQAFLVSEDFENLTPKDKLKAQEKAKQVQSQLFAAKTGDFATEATFLNKKNQEKAKLDKQNQALEISKSYREDYASKTAGLVAKRALLAGSIIPTDAAAVKADIQKDKAQARLDALSALKNKYGTQLSPQGVDKLDAKIEEAKVKLSEAITAHALAQNKAAKFTKDQTDKRAKEKKASEYKGDLAAALVLPSSGDLKDAYKAQAEALKNVRTTHAASISKETLGKLDQRIAAAERRANAPAKVAGEALPAGYERDKWNAVFETLRNNLTADKRTLAGLQAEQLKKVKATYESKLPEAEKRRLDADLIRRQAIAAGTTAAKTGTPGKPKKTAADTAKDAAAKQSAEGFNSLLTFFSYSQLISALDSFAKKMLEAASAMEQYKRRVDIVIHNTQQAGDFFRFLKQYEKITPYDINQVMTAGVAFASQQKTINQSGLSKEGAVRLAGELGSLNPSAGIIEAQRSISRIAAGDPNGLEILRSQFSITNEILREFGAQDALTDTGVSLRSVRNRQLVIKAIDSYIQSVTKGEGTLGQSQTLQGRVSTLGSQAFQTAGDIFQPMMAPMTGFISTMTSLLEKISGLDNASKQLIGTFTVATLGTSLLAQGLMGLQWLVKPTLAKLGYEHGLSSIPKMLSDNIGVDPRVKKGLTAKGLRGGLFGAALAGAAADPLTQLVTRSFCGYERRGYYICYWWSYKCWPGDGFCSWR